MSYEVKKFMMLDEEEEKEDNITLSAGTRDSFSRFSVEIYSRQLSAANLSPSLVSRRAVAFRKISAEAIQAVDQGVAVVALWCLMMETKEIK